jgi:hypothetical protein
VPGNSGEQRAGELVQRAPGRAALVTEGAFLLGEKASRFLIGRPPFFALILKTAKTANEYRPKKPFGLVATFVTISVLV